MSEYELYHHGVKGMKWGVRRYQNKDGSLTAAGRKRQAKEEYKKSKASAKEIYYNAKKKADFQYEKDIAKKTEALNKVKKTYDAKDAVTEQHYKSEIEKRQRDADQAKEDMDFWSDPDSMFYKEAAAKYFESNQQIRDLEVRRDAVMMANKFERDNATIKVKELFAKSSEQAANRRAEAYDKASKDYSDNLKTAKTNYKNAKKGRDNAASGNVKEKAVRVAAKGASVASKAALYSAVDDVFYGGAGKKIAKETIIQTGRAAVTAYTMARGGYDIKWYDNYGRRVG